MMQKAAAVREMAARREADDIHCLPGNNSSATGERHSLAVNHESVFGVCISISWSAWNAAVFLYKGV